MVITYQGVQSFRVQFGDIVLALDPISKKSHLIGGQAKFKAASFGADIVLVSLNHSDMNGVEQTSRGEKEPFIIKGPGEYEIQGVFVKGLPSVSKYDGEEKLNTIYTVHLENINLCFLGALSKADLPNETKAGLDGVDILFVPIGGEGVLSPAEAYKLAVSLEPAIIIPMNYPSSALGPSGDKALKAFLKEGGEEGMKPIEKLTIKKKDLENKKGDIIVLDTQ